MLRSRALWVVAVLVVVALFPSAAVETAQMVVATVLKVLGGLLEGARRG